MFSNFTNVCPGELRLRLLFISVHLNDMHMDKMGKQLQTHCEVRTCHSVQFQFPNQPGIQPVAWTESGWKWTSCQDVARGSTAWSTIICYVLTQTTPPVLPLRRTHAGAPTEAHQTSLRIVSSFTHSAD